MNKAEVLAHLRAAAAGHRKDPTNSPIRISVHAAMRMIERGVVTEDIVNTFSGPKPNDVRESTNGDGRWEVRGRTIDNEIVRIVVVFEERPNTIVITVIV